MKRIILFLLSAFLIASCAPVAQTLPTEIITAYATSAAQPWMSDLFACANKQNIIVEVTAENPDIVLRVASLGLKPGTAGELTFFSAYQIGEEEIVVAVNRESTIRNLSLDEVQGLFAGQGGAVVWVYASGEDLQGVFDQAIMEGRSVTSFARIASSPQELSAVLASESDAIGFLPKRWVVGNLRAVYSLGSFPVLAMTREEPQGAVNTLLGCLHSN